MTNLNPLHLIDSILEDWVSARVRRTFHSVLLLAAIVVGIYFAFEGNWQEVIGALVAAVYAGSNRANTEPIDDAYPSFYNHHPDPSEYDYEEGDDLNAEATSFDEPVSGNPSEGFDRRV